MSINACPVCRSTKFYIKDPDDEYETYEFETKDGDIHFDDIISESEQPDIKDDTEAFCSTCAWHDKLEKLR